MNVLIVGDSWACGAYTDERIDNNEDKSFTHEPIQVLKPLLEADGHSVRVVCNPGGNDKQSLKLLKKHGHSDDVVIFYKTCTLRSIRLDDITQAGGLKNAIDKFDNRLYRELESLSMRVFLIGGLDKIVQHVDVEYVLPSLPEYLLNEPIPQHSSGRDFFDDFGNWYNYKKVSIDDLELANELMMDSIKMYRLFADNPMYFPDLGHPGEKSTKIFYDLIKEKL